MEKTKQRKGLESDWSRDWGSFSWDTSRNAPLKNEVGACSPREEGEQSSVIGMEGKAEGRAKASVLAGTSVRVTERKLERKAREMSSRPGSSDSVSS